MIPVARLSNPPQASLGKVSCVCGLVNGPKQMIDIQAGVEFAASFEQVQHADKMQKEAAALA